MNVFSSGSCASLSDIKSNDEEEEVPAPHAPSRPEWTCRNLTNIHQGVQRMPVVNLIHGINSYSSGIVASSDEDWLEFTTDVFPQSPTDHEKTMFAQDHGRRECFLIDSGATDSVMSTSKYLTNFKLSTASCKGMAAASVETTGRGDLLFQVRMRATVKTVKASVLVDGRIIKKREQVFGNLLISDVLHVPDSICWIFSKL